MPGPTHAEAHAGPAEAVKEAVDDQVASIQAALGPLGASQALALQRLGGDRAARAAIAPRRSGFALPPPLTVLRPQDAAQRSLAAAVQARGPAASIARCAGHECRCGGFGREDGRVTLAKIPIGDRTLLPMIQRQPAEEGGESAMSSGARPANASVVEDKSHLKPSIQVNDVDARAIVAEAIAKIGGVPGAKAFPFDEAIAASEPPSAAGEQSIATWPAGKQMIQRSILHMLEGGFVGSLQLCYDFCKGPLSVVGWIWAGLGIVTPAGRRQEVPRRVRVRRAGVRQLGLRGAQGQLRHVPYLGPVGAAVSAAAKGISTWTKKYGLEVECGSASTSAGRSTCAARGWR